MTTSRLPPLAVVLGVAALLPLIGAALYAVSANTAGNPHGALPLIAYAAVALSFLGGVHWGFVLDNESAQAERTRLGLGVLPGLLGWGAVLLGIGGQGVLGLAVLIAAFIGTALVENHAYRKDLVPRGYMLLRWFLTVVIVALLTTALVLRMVGAHILL